MCYIQVKNIRLNSFYEEKKIKLCLTKQLLNMFKLWCEWGISLKCWCKNFVAQEFTNSLSYCTCYFKIIFLVTGLCTQQSSAKTLRDKDWVIDVLTCLWLVDKEKIISIVWYTEGKIWNVLQNISPHQKWSCNDKLTSKTPESNFQ